MNKIKYLYFLIIVLLAACGANVAPTLTTPAINTPHPTNTSNSTRTPEPALTVAPVTETQAPTATQTASKADPLRPSSSDAVLTLAPGVTIEMVRIPAGEFLMGSADSDKNASDEEKPQNKVMLDEYLIGKYDVTNAQYAIFAKATNLSWTMPSGKENHPVVSVAWDDAVAFCAWVSQVTGRKVKLPSEAQWEKAARGTDGRLFPWGDSEPDTSKLNYNNNVKDTTAVGKYSPAGDSPYGVADMAGNVFQWTSSLWGNHEGTPTYGYPYNPNDGREDPSSRDLRVLRGGANDGGRPFVRSAYRYMFRPDLRLDNFGFRVAVLPI